MLNSVEKLKRASFAVYFLDGAKEPADDCSSLLRWAVGEIERLQAALKGVEIALARDEDVDAAMRIIRHADAPSVTQEKEQ